VPSGPEDGCYIRGLYMEGARWNSETHLVDDSRPKELFTDCPVVSESCFHSGDRDPSCWPTYLNIPAYTYTGLLLQQRLAALLSC
jgi:hypothetical protein